MICLHVHLASHDTLITGDKGMFRCVTHSLKLFNAEADPEKIARCHVL